MSLFESYENESAGESPIQEWEFAGSQGEFAGESEEEYGGGAAFEFEEEYENESENEQLEYQLAQELMEITNEQELEQFIGNLVRSAGRFLNSGVGRAIGGVLKNVARTALPIVGGALGSFVAPGIGTAIGGQLGSMASKMFEAGELEMLGEQEAEFEAARRFVQFGRGTVRYAATAPRNMRPNMVARQAAIASARQYAPTLLRPSGQRGWRDRRSTRTYRSRPTYGRRPRRQGPPWQWGGPAWPVGWVPGYGASASWGAEPSGPWSDDAQAGANGGQGGQGGGYDPGSQGGDNGGYDGGNDETGFEFG